LAKLDHRLRDLEVQLRPDAHAAKGK